MLFVDVTNTPSWLLCAKRAWFVAAWACHYLPPAVRPRDAHDACEKACPLPASRTVPLLLLHHPGHCHVIAALMASWGHCTCRLCQLPTWLSAGVFGVQSV